MQNETKYKIAIGCLCGVVSILTFLVAVCIYIFLCAIRMSMMMIPCLLAALCLPVFAQEFPVDYLRSLPDAPETSKIPESHNYKLEQHNGMCVGCAVTQAGEKMLEFYGTPDERYVIAWTHFAGRNVKTTYTDEMIGLYGSDAALAIELIGFLPASKLEGVEKNLWNADPVSKLDVEDWESFYNKYKDKADKYPIAHPRNINEVALCLAKGLPVLFLSSAQWRLISWKNVDGKGNNRMEFATTQYNTKEAHVVCLRDYFTLPYYKDNKPYPMEYCNLVNSHGEYPSPLKLLWLDKIQADSKFSCFVILPKEYGK